MMSNKLRLVDYISDDRTYELNCMLSYADEKNFLLSNIIDHAWGDLEIQDATHRYELIGNASPGSRTFTIEDITMRNAIAFVSSITETIADYGFKIQTKYRLLGYLTSKDLKSNNDDVSVVTYTFKNKQGVERKCDLKMSDSGFHVDIAGTMPGFDIDFEFE